MNLGRDGHWEDRLSRAAGLGLGRRYAPRHGRAAFLLGTWRDYVGASVIDVGAGATAPILANALGSGYEALDIGDSYKIESSAERGALRHVADIEGKRLPFRDRQFDTAICLDVLEHIDDIHHLFDELFRVAARSVIISLPNNWPGFVWSLVAGQNVTHRAGYGLGPAPKLAGQRHKHFFNFEEACAFAFGRVPEGFEVRDAAFLFEHGADGLLATLPPLTRFFRLTGKARMRDATEHFGAPGPLVWLGAKAVYLPARLLDIALTALVYGWGRRVRFYNMFCRQIWVAYERVAAQRDTGGAG